MIKFTKILCPTNLTPESDEGLRYGLALASAYDAELKLLYCATGNDRAAEFRGTAPINRYFDESLAPHLAASINGQPRWEGIVVESQEDPGEEIVRVAAERSVDLIVMRSRRRPRAAALLGSTAESVYRTAPCPVLVTHQKERQWISPTTGEIELERIVVAHDFSNDSELAVQYAFSLAQEYQAELHLMHVLRRPEDESSEIGWGAVGREAAYKLAARRLQNALPDEAGWWSTIVRAVRWGKPYQEVLAYAHEHQIDLICMGAKGGNFGLGALFGSNVDRVLRQSPCPVLVARPLRPALAGA